MLSTTRRVISFFDNGISDENLTLLKPCLNAILKRGSIDDAAALLDLFLDNPHDYYRSYFFDVFSKFGNDVFAEKIFKRCFANGRLADDISGTVLQLLGFLQYLPAKPLIFDYALKTPDYSESAIMGLLNFDCTEYEAEIKQAITETYNRNLFDEFIPALACKVKANDDMLEKLCHYVETTTSTDCNAGVIFGFSLCGKTGEAYFRKAIFSPAWEVHLSGTGTGYWAYVGLVNLGISFGDLFSAIKNIADEGGQEHALKVLAQLLEYRINNNGVYPVKTPNTAESFINIYNSFFGNAEGITVSDLAEKTDLFPRFSILEDFINLKIEEEVLLQATEIK